MLCAALLNIIVIAKNVLLVFAYFHSVYLDGYKRVYTVKLLCLLQMLYENLRGEMTVSATGAKISLRDSKFIQVVARSVGVSCKEVHFHQTQVTFL